MPGFWVKPICLTLIKISGQCPFNLPNSDKKVFIFSNIAYKSTLTTGCVLQQLN